MSPYEKCDLVIAAAGVLFTFLAVLIAIWGQPIRNHWSKPRLQIALKPPVFAETTHGKKGWYYLISVTNTRRSAPAQHVQLLLTTIWKQDPAGSWYEHVFSGPVQVTWRWHHNTPQFRTIGPEAHAVLGTLREDEQFKLQLYLYPTNIIKWIRWDEPTLLVFKAVSDTAESKPLAIELTWDGKWTDAQDDIGKHCVVRPTTEPDS
jgi:hypothetical protein